MRQDQYFPVYFEIISSDTPASVWRLISGNQAKSCSSFKERVPDAKPLPFCELPSPYGIAGKNFDFKTHQSENLRKSRRSYGIAGENTSFKAPSRAEPNQNYEPVNTDHHSMRNKGQMPSHRDQMNHNLFEEDTYYCVTPPPNADVPPIIPGPHFYRETYSSPHTYPNQEMNSYYRAVPKPLDRMMPAAADRRYGPSDRRMYEDSMHADQLRVDKLSMDPLSRVPGIYAHRDPQLPAHMLDVQSAYPRKYGAEPMNLAMGPSKSFVPNDPYLSILSQPEDGNVSHLIGRVVYLAKSESGSRFVQEKCGDPRFLKVFYNEMKKRLPELMTDNFGHYAVEALFSQCSQSQRIALLSNLGPQLSSVACHKQGSFSVQSIITSVNSKEEIYLVRDYLKEDLEHIILSCPGHYVILRFISRFGWPVSNFISETLALNVVGFATDHYGLRVLKATFDSARQNNVKKLNQAIIDHTNSLAENQYGNYIIQHLLDVGPEEVSNDIKNKMVGRFVRYSKQKFSSNVVEKCLKHSVTHANTENDWIEIIVRELLGCAKELISDKYGNYCLQTALNCIQKNPSLVSEFIEKLRPHLEHLRVNVRQKWMKLLQVASTQQMSESAI